MTRKNTCNVVLYKYECEIFNPEKQIKIFSWMIDKYDELCYALIMAGELAEEEGRK